MYVGWCLVLIYSSVTLKYYLHIFASLIWPNYIPVEGSRPQILLVHFIKEFIVSDCTDLKLMFLFGVCMDVCEYDVFFKEFSSLGEGDMAIHVVKEEDLGTY